MSDLGQDECSEYIWLELLDDLFPRSPLFRFTWHRYSRVVDQTIESIVANYGFDL